LTENQTNQVLAVAAVVVEQRVTMRRRRATQRWTVCCCCVGSWTNSAGTNMIRIVVVPGTVVSVQWHSSTWKTPIVETRYSSNCPKSTRRSHPHRPQSFRPSTNPPSAGGCRRIPWETRRVSDWKTRQLRRRHHRDRPGRARESERDRKSQGSHRWAAGTWSKRTNLRQCDRRDLFQRSAQRMRRPCAEVCFVCVCFSSTRASLVDNYLASGFLSKTETTADAFRWVGHFPRTFCRQMMTGPTFA
jgi:hypothetical protein